MLQQGLMCFLNELFLVFNPQYANRDVILMGQDAIQSAKS